ncbi:MAG: NUDIX hydrolase [Crocinitomicaceae bacterium TMED209]|nr:MAG: NUDIX hydrolase [Crocinitomicaceae bacterium TMED209]
MLAYPQEDPDFGVALSTSLVLFGFDGSHLQILLARSNRPPYKGALFLPSRYLNKEDELMLSARKMFEQLFGYEDPTMIEQLQAFGKVFRHPGGRIINISHYALVRKEDFLAENWDKHGMQWVAFDQVPDLAFDHNEIVQYAKERLKRRVKRRPVGFRLLPDEFTLGQLQNFYETALGKTFDKRNFRKKLFKTTLLIDLEKKADGKAPGQHKGSQLFSFNKDKYQKMKIQGYDFLF